MICTLSAIAREIGFRGAGSASSASHQVSAACALGPGANQRAWGSLVIVGVELVDRDCAIRCGRAHGIVPAIQAFFAGMDARDKPAHHEAKSELAR